MMHPLANSRDNNADKYMDEDLQDLDAITAGCQASASSILPLIWQFSALTKPNNITTSQPVAGKQTAFKSHLLSPPLTAISPNQYAQVSDDHDGAVIDTPFNSIDDLLHISWPSDPYQYPLSPLSGTISAASFEDDFMLFGTEPLSNSHWQNTAQKTPDFKTISPYSVFDPASLTPNLTLPAATIKAKPAVKSPQCMVQKRESEIFATKSKLSTKISKSSKSRSSHKDVKPLSPCRSALSLDNFDTPPLHQADAIIDSLFDFVHILSCRGIILHATPSKFLSLSKLSAEALVGQHIREICHPQDLMTLMRELKDCPDNGSVSISYRIRTANLDYLWMDVIGRRHLVGHRKQTKCFVLTGRLRQVEDMQELSTIVPRGELNAQKMWFAKVSPQGLILHVFGQSSPVFGVSGELMYGKSLRDFMSSADSKNLSTILHQPNGSTSITVKANINHQTLRVPAYLKSYRGPNSDHAVVSISVSFDIGCEIETAVSSNVTALMDSHKLTPALLFEHTYLRLWNQKLQQSIMS